MKTAAVRIRALAKKPQADSDPFFIDAIKGLSAKPKYMLAKHFYDAEGSRLFERIMRLPEYYPT
jgi:L-histidine Nalpha-methyltransferase